MQENQIPGVVKGLKKAGWKVSSSTHNEDVKVKEFELFHPVRRQTMDLSVDYEPDEEDFNALVEE